MATKTTYRGRTKVESEQLTDGAYARKGNDGTAMALAQAVEESSMTIHCVEQSKSNITGKLEVRVWTTYGGSNSPDPQTVPKSLDKLLRSWGYETDDELPNNDPLRDAHEQYLYVKQ